MQGLQPGEDQGEVLSSVQGMLPGERLRAGHDVLRGVRRVSIKFSISDSRLNCFLLQLDPRPVRGHRRRGVPGAVPPTGQRGLRLQVSVLLQPLQI